MPCWRHLYRQIFRQFAGINQSTAISLNLAGGAFIPGSSELSPKARAVLKETAKVLDQYPDEKIIIKGHTDAAGDDVHNLVRAKQRVQTAPKFLAKEENLSARRHGRGMPGQTAGSWQKIGSLVRNREKDGDIILAAEPIPNMSVQLPPKGVALTNPLLTVNGTTDMGNRVLINLDPDKIYPVYGDSSTVVYGTDTQGKLYLALGSDEVHMLMGNYLLNLSDTELAAYSRTLYGVNVADQSVSATRYGDPNIKIAVFGAEVRQVHVRDELRATGGSLTLDTLNFSSLVTLPIYSGTACNYL
jgi:hypothetical protein